MTDEQRADYEAGQRAAAFNVTNSTPLGVIGAADDTLGPIMAGITDQVKAITIAESAQQHDGGDAATDKAAKKVAMGDTVIKYALRGEVKATAIGNTVIATSLQHPVGYISDADDVLAVTHANDMKGIMDTNKGPGGVLTNIVAADIDVMTAGIKAFTDVTSVPTAAVKEKKAQGTDKIQPAVDLLLGYMEMEKKLLHSYWNDTVNKGLSDEFDLKSHPIILGKHHNIASVTLLKDEDGKELKGGLVTCLKNKKTSDGAKTNVYEIVGIQVGIQDFKAEAPGRVVENFEILIKRGKKVEVTVRMKLV